MGCTITDAQIEELRAKIYDIDYDMAAKEEKILRHDVMAHVHTYGAQCPGAKEIIHLGATSAYVGDNTDIITYTEGLVHVKGILVNLICQADGFCHGIQGPAHPGLYPLPTSPADDCRKRATLWIQDLLLDYEDLCHLISNVRLRGAKGTTGTQASFMDALRKRPGQGEADRCPGGQEDGLQNLRCHRANLSP